ncbi:UDP-N-acetylmuramoyl-tripeptide--D-alanyl-D-alanine ligase [Desulfuromonas sp. TF]|uniref:UDP-N-acetylmuramoyl-tripeptide--D-alanyl-D- alanine ligase n=1 Tax=Desulfuromonas sp. TF TaxID=1232410 RepID=UPI000414B67D|nr:UDP-N-acetylmuramoyl-tripeptide--D-alanyl-D-alanine ligase [Desulfuromonas sp. TF]
MKLTLQQLAQILGADITPSGARATVSGISTDSRTVGRGELFVPLRGDRFDGHDFLCQAARQGAAACLSEEVLSGFPVPVIRVENTLAALGNLAASLRRGFSGPVIAVTGSSGKTTTKEMLSAILSLSDVGLKTAGNFNNLIGLPLTLFRLEPRHRWAILEMGMSARREIARLAEIADPTVGVITNVGPAHLETLLNLDGVARAKGELFAALKPGGTAVINADDELVAQLPVANGVRRLLFGTSPEAQVRAEEIEVTGEAVCFRLLVPEGERFVTLKVPGRHNVSNALAAAAAAASVGVGIDLIVRGLENFTPVSGRMEVVRGEDGVLFIEDGYNANPLSVRVALEALDEMGGSGRRVAVLGDMLELGSGSDGFHREAGWVAARRCDYLLLMGGMAEHTSAGARERGMQSDRVRVVGSHDEAAEYLRRILRPGDRVLIKGSRGMKMEKIGAALRAPSSPLAVNHG